MAPEHRPVATGFFPAARVGLTVGVLVAVLGAVLLRREPVSEAPVVEPALEQASVAQGEVARAPGEPPRALVGPVVAHVWLENCPDCMSAFAAHARLQEENALAGMTQVNVAYGTSTPAFRAKYHVDANLIEDGDGSKVVARYGIGSFTTLVIDARGALLLSDRPDRLGYVERVRAAWQKTR